LVLFNSELNSVERKVTRNGARICIPERGAIERDFYYIDYFDSGVGIDEQVECESVAIVEHLRLGRLWQRIDFRERSLVPAPGHQPGFELRVEWSRRYCELPGGGIWINEKIVSKNGAPFCVYQNAMNEFLVNQSLRLKYRMGCLIVGSLIRRRECSLGLKSYEATISERHN